MSNYSTQNQPLKVVYQPIEELILYNSNPRTHSTKQVQQIAKSIKEFGFTNPILIDQAQNVIAGHGRIAAAKKLKLTEVPTIQLEAMSEAQKRVYIIADNKLAENAGWDNDLLKIEFQYLSDLDIDFDLSFTGFEIAEIDQILEFNDTKRSDPKFDVPTTAVSRLGDIWNLGNHRLICGNALDPMTLNALMAGKKAQMVFTDPPYNVPIGGHVCSTDHREFAMASGEMSQGEFVKFLETSFQQLIEYSENGSIHFICMDWRHISEVMAAGVQYKELKNLCIWNKTNGGMGSFYRSKYELVFVFKNGAKPHINNIELGKHGRYRTNVWDYAGINTFSEGRNENLASHPTVKPLQMVADAILDCSKPKGLILDIFGGSGTTLLAAEQTGRHARLVELDPIYVDVILKRFEDMTGQKAIHEQTGKLFKSLKRSRLNGKR